MADSAPRYLIFDIGTGDIRSAVTEGNTVRAMAQTEWCWTSDPRWPFSFSFDPSELRRHLFSLAKTVIRQAAIQRVDAIAATSQRHNFVLLNHQGQAFLGLPNIARVEGVRQPNPLPSALQATLYKTAGRWPVEMCPAVRLQQALRIRPELRAQIAAITSISDWIGYELTEVLAYDVTQAAETLLMDMVHHQWQEDTMALLEIPSHWLPTLIHPGTRLGQLKPHAAAILGLEPGIPVITVGADTQTAVYAVTDRVHDVVIVAGTTTPVVQITDTPIVDNDGRSWTDVHVQPARWLVESNCGITGLTYQWIRQWLYPHEDYTTMEQEVAAITDPLCLGVVGASLMDARVESVSQWGGFIFPIPVSRAIAREHMAWAALWDMACAIRLNCDQVVRVTGQTPGTIWGVGGGFLSRTLGRMVATLLQTPLQLVGYGPQASLWGAVSLCNDAQNYPRSMPPRTDLMIHPAPPTADYARWFSAWCQWSARCNQVPAIEWPPLRTTERMTRHG